MDIRTYRRLREFGHRFQLATVLRRGKACDIALDLLYGPKSAMARTRDAFLEPDSAETAAAQFLLSFPTFLDLHKPPPGRRVRYMIYVNGTFGIHVTLQPCIEDKVGKWPVHDFRELNPGGGVGRGAAASKIFPKRATRCNWIAEVCV
jgi:hypothetical protein